MSTKYITSSNNTYRAYTAILSQTGINAPTATVLESTLISNVVWSYDSTGEYLATVTNNDFVNLKTVLFISPIDGSLIKIERINDNVINVGTRNSSGIKTDNILNDTSIEIRVYN